MLGYSALKTGFAFLPLPVTVFLMSQRTSRVLSHRVSSKALMLGGRLLGTTGFALASRLHPGSSYPQILASLLLFAVGNGISFIPLTQAALEGVPAKDAGAASGLVNVTQQLGGTLGVALVLVAVGVRTPGKVAAAPAPTVEHRRRRPADIGFSSGRKACPRPFSTVQQGGQGRR